MSFYQPQLGPAASETTIEGEISFLRFLLGDLDENAPTYQDEKAHHKKNIVELQNMLNAVFNQPGTTAGPSSTMDVGWLDFAVSPPSTTTPEGSGSSGSSSRKRSYASIDGTEGFHNKRLQDETGYSLAPPNNPPFSPSLVYRTHPAPTQSSVVSQRQPDPSDVIDLTGDDGPLRSFFNVNPPQNQSYDPFAELDNAFRGMDTRPSQAFNQDFMDNNALAEFLTRPGPPLLNFPSYGSAMAPGMGMAPGVSMAPGMTPGMRMHGSSIGPGGWPVHNTLTRHGHLGGFRPNLSPYQSFGCDQDSMLDEGAGSEALNKLIEGLQPDEEVAKELREETPRAMCSQLMEHQKLGLTWLKKNETSSNKGGILADDMGLGKTVQAISLIVSRPSDDPACKTTLIVAPVALMRQWQKEIERHVHAHSRLSVYIYHGAGKKAKFDKLRQFDVVLTTYGTLTWEYKRKESRADIARNSCHIIGPTSKWHRVILDEAQCIKNKSTIVSKASNELRATYRLCMTGTPMMNSIDELYPLIRFLQIKPYNDDARFRSHISKPIKNANEREMGIKRVQVLLKSFMLRRAKDTKIDGEEICKIPPKHVHKDDVEFDEDERELYSAIETNSQLKFNKYLAKGTVTNNYANILVLLLRLRQACCHPHLIKDLGVQVSTEGIPEEDLLSRAKQLHGDVVNRLKVMENFECPICYEAIPNPTVFLPCGHTCCGECFQKLIDPSQAIREGVETNNAKCPHCRGPLSSERITDYHHFCKVFSPEKLHLFGEAKDENEEVAVADAESDDESDDDSDTESDSEAEEDEDAGSDLDDFVVPDGADDDYEAPVKVKGESSKKRRTKGGRGKKKKSKGKAKAEDDDDNLPKLKKTLAQLKQESLRNQAAKKKYLKRLRKTFKSSSKIDRTVELLTEIRNNDPSEKTLIFSQFTTLLDLVEVPLQDRGFKYQRYDGSMKMDDRADAVNAFMDESDQTIMLVSLKAGNAGLNLNKASQVIILDPFWNPFVEDQAVDRAHRMPQKREVNVHRLLVPETVEDRIITLQDGKRELITAALDENASKSISRLSIGDLKYLFGLGPRPSR